MWQLENQTPFAADSGWMLDPNGEEIWMVAVKATYGIAPDGDTFISPEQVPVSPGPAQDDAGAPLCESDLNPFKKNTDVLLLGHAHAPHGEPVTELPVGFRIGQLERKAAVFGDRHWERGTIRYHPSSSKPFTRMPLHWGRAFGGIDPHNGQPLPNPVGCGILTNVSEICPLPNIEHPRNWLRTPQDRPEPMGFGPVPCHWLWRARHGGTYDEAWRDTRAPLLPLDIDPRYWQIAPPKQQYARFVQGGEPIVLIHLTAPEHTQRPGRLQTVLPSLSLQFHIWFYDGTRTRSNSHIHTVILEPDHPRLVVVHHMSLRCKSRQLDRTIIQTG
jgi:hypothetical protein